MAGAHVRAWPNPELFLPSWPDRGSGLGRSGQRKPTASVHYRLSFDQHAIHEINFAEWFLDRGFIEAKNFGGLIDHLRDGLADGGEFVGWPTCHGDIVKPDDRDVIRDAEICSADRVDSTDRHNVAGEEYAVRPYILANKTIGCAVSCSVAEGAALFMSMKCNAQLLQPPGKSSRSVEVGRCITLAAHVSGPHMSRVVKILGDHPATCNVIAADCRHLQGRNIAVE